MALIKCNQCGNMVSDNAQACPHCGNPMQGAYGQPPQNYNAFNNPNQSTKSRTTAGILAILLGGIGVHYFYLGKTIAGIVFLVTCCTGIPSILALIQGIMMLTMTDEQFNAKYVNNPSQFPLF